MQYGFLVPTENIEKRRWKKKRFTAAAIAALGVFLAVYMAGGALARTVQTQGLSVAVQPEPESAVYKDEDWDFTFVSNFSPLDGEAVSGDPKAVKFVM